MTKHVAPKQRANKTPNSLVKVVVKDERGKWIKPAANADFEIGADAVFPLIEFEIETEHPGPFKWSWAFSWDARASGLRESAKRGSLCRTFTEKWSFESDKRTWVAAPGKVLGGRLAVQVVAGTETFKRTVNVKGLNPSQAAVEALVATLPDCEGLSQLLEQESKFKHFIFADGQPVVAFDGGYGMTQLTHPAPTFEQAWNWKENVRAGAKLYQEKQKLAKTYLAQQGRSFSSEQLRLETWSRWNGGAYHLWDASSKSWKRNDDLLCDTSTGNIGWDTTLPDNSGKSEADLHKRDKGSYGNPKKNKTSTNEWRYTGVCYADHVNAN